MKLLGLDPGFASIGTCVVDVPADVESTSLKIVHFGLVSTEKSSKKSHFFDCEDNVRRAIEIARALDALIDSDVVAICAESMSFPRSSSVAAKMAMCWGVISTLSHHRRIPVLQSSPQAIKIAIAGRKDASKVDMTRAVVRRFPSIAERIVDFPRDDREHPVDALCAALTCMESDLIKMMRRATAR